VKTNRPRHPKSGRENYRGDEVIHRSLRRKSLRFLASHE